jgi:hypothetical protein
MTTQELIHNEVNCTTGEVITRPFTDEEVVAWETVQAANATRQAEQEAEATRIAELKASAVAKLAALGLTSEEIAAL